MTSTLQGIIIALLTGLLVGILVGYFLVQGRVRRQNQALKEGQRRLADLEQDYEARLQETTQQLRHDYEADLAKTIEHYQDQLSRKSVELQQSHETRLKVLQQGLTDSTAQQSTLGRSDTGSLSRASESPLSRPEVQHLRQQYEIRLKEAAQRLQNAYEKQLAHHVKAAKTELETDYEKRFAEKIKQDDEALSVRQAQLEQDYASRIEALNQAQARAVSHPATSMSGGTGDETTVTLQPAVPLSSAAATQPPLVSPMLTQADIDQRIQVATQQVRQDYEQQLSARLKEYKDQISSRVRELEEDYRNRLKVLSDLETKSSQTTEQDYEETLDPLDLSDISQLT